MDLELLNGRLSICRLHPASPFPEWVAAAPGFTSITRTPDELSIVCNESSVPPGVLSESGWRIFKIQGPLDFTLTGVLASIAEPLARAGIAIFAISTFDTDYVMVKEDRVEAATQALIAAGHRVGPFVSRP